MASIQKELVRLDQQRRELLKFLQTLDMDKLTAKPLPDKWSILEIVHHLVLTERYVLRQLPEPSLLGDRKRTLRNRVLYPVVKFVLRFGIPVKAPSRAILPVGNPSWAELRQQWDENQHWLKSYIDGLDSRTVGKAVFRHPLAGALTVKQTLCLLRLHLNRHEGQIKRLLK